MADKGSTDQTLEVVRSAAAAHGQHCIRYLSEPVTGLLSGRHRGVAEAEGDLLVFVDDDIVIGGKSTFDFKNF